MCRRVHACATPESDERPVWVIRGVTGWGVPEPGVLCIGPPWALVPKPVSGLPAHRVLPAGGWKLSGEISLWG